jgi:hypothetical protein
MFKIFYLIILAQLLMSCASRTPGTDKLVKSQGDLAKSAHIEAVPFNAQEDNHCGPSTLWMALEAKGKSVSLQEITDQTFTKDLEGTLKADMLGSARRQVMLTIPVNDLESMLIEVSEKNPVIVFQNLGFEKIPKWHFSLLHGYNLKGPDVILHSGKEKDQKMDMRLFERSWLLGGKWAYILLNPGEISKTANEKEHLEAAAALENLHYMSAAYTSYEAILKKWPKSLGAMIGLGNIYYANKNLKQSESILTQATELHPESPLAWHNLAIVEKDLKQNSEARASAKKAIELADPELKKKLEESLAGILR